jgi:Bacterial Ig domain
MKRQWLATLMMWMIMVLTPALAAAQSVTSNSPCQIAAGGSNCTVHVTWNTLSSRPIGCLWTSAGVVFACGNPSDSADWPYATPSGSTLLLRAHTSWSALNVSDPVLASTTVFAKPPPSGSLSSNSPCHLPGPSAPDRCTINFTYTFANTPVACVWETSPSLALVSCSGASPFVQSWPWTAIAPEIFELHAHQTYPSGTAAEFNASPKLGSALSVNAVGTTVTVTLSNPTASSPQAYDVGQSVMISANATDSGGVNPTVRFSVNGTNIATISQPPYQVSYQPSAGGLYTVVATASDASGGQATSTAKMVFERLVPLISPGTVTIPTFVYNDPNADVSTWPLVFGAWHLSQRRTPINAVAVPLSLDFSKAATSNTSTCPFIADSADCVLTHFGTPAPFANYQRGQVDSNPNFTSGFQQYGSDVGSFINTWQSGCISDAGGGPHSAYEFRPTTGLNQPGIAVFSDGDPNTEFVLQGDFEVPWLLTDPNPQGDLHVQVSLFAQFTSTDNSKTFFALAGIFDQIGLTPETASNPGLMTSPVLAAKGLYKDLYAYNGGYQPQMHSASWRSNLWTGMATYRQYLSRAGFQAFLNQFYPGQGLTPSNFTLVDFGVLHEILGCSATLNASTAYHARNVGAYKALFN